MPAMQPAELWQESGRWEQYGPELLRLKDRHERDFVVGPTHEEVVSRPGAQGGEELSAAAGRTSIRSRPSSATRSGRASASCAAREFIMKDAYSFHADKAGLERTYQDMYEAYTRIFTRSGLTLPRGGGRHRRDRRHRLARVPRACRFRRGRDRLLPELGLRRQRRAGRGACTGRAQRHSRWRRCARLPTPGKTTCEAVCQLLELPTCAARVKAIVVDAGGHARACCCCAATTR